MKTEILAVVVIVLVAVSLGVGYFVSQQTAKTTPTVSSSSSAQGLILTTNISSNTIRAGETLGISISLYNSLPRALNITAITNSSSAWKIDGFPVAMWDGCTGMEPVEFMIIKGNYSYGEFQAAAANSYYPAIFCAEGGSVLYISFPPMSSNVTTTGNFCVETCSPNHTSWNLSTSFSVDGYWAYPLNSSETNDIYTSYTGCPNPPCEGITYNYPEVGPEAQHTFTPGLYTLLVADEWGQTVFLYFSVV
ncbi:MAG TPA: hypothetical protein VEJ19_00515 [Nitrososphaerales archaeon]|nr:hypothetical protein [Nitrososphaerales archaeon]